MSLSDCIKCYDTPCTCGYQYEKLSNEKLYDQIILMIRVLTIKNKSPLNPIIQEIINKSKKEGIN